MLTLKHDLKISYQGRVHRSMFRGLDLLGALMRLRFSVREIKMYIPLVSLPFPDLRVLARPLKSLLII